MTQLYTVFTFKLLKQHEKKCRKMDIGTLDDVPTEMKRRLLEVCRLAWEGIVEQQLTFSSEVLSGDTLGLLCEVRELFGKDDRQTSYHFIHLTLQEFLSAYYITHLPLDKQKQVIQEHIEKEHLNGVVRFYFGLTKSNYFTSRMISEHLLEGATAHHWLFEAGYSDIFNKELGSERTVRVESSYSWSSLDYYVVGHSIAHYQIQWELDFRYASMGDEMAMLSEGMASISEASWNGKLRFYFASISLDGVQLFANIPLQLLQQILSLDFSGTKLDKKALNVFYRFLPKLTKLQGLYVRGNPIGEGGAVEVLKCLHDYRTPLKELDLADTGVGDEDCAQLALLLANIDLEKLSIGGNMLSSRSVASILESLLRNDPTRLRHLNMLQSDFSDENCVVLASFLSWSTCQLRELDMWGCSISGEGTRHLVTALSNNHSLTVFSLSCNPIGDVGAVAFEGVARNNTMLITLHMAGCEITSAGCTRLAAGLTENTTLQALWLDGNHVGMEGAKALSEVIAENKSLKEISLSGDNSLGRGVDSLLANLEKNTTLQWVCLSAQYIRLADPRVE